MPPIKSLALAAIRKVRSLFYTPEERRHALVGPARFWKMKRDFQIAFLKRQGLQPEHYLLDVGCGTLRGGVPLIDYLEPAHYYGMEVRAEVLDEGRDEVREAGLAGKDPQLVVAPDHTQVNLDQRFDFIWAFSVLIHMTDEIADACFGMVSRHLADDGVFYANVNTDIASQHEGRWQGFPVNRREVAFYRQLAQKHGMQVEDIGTIEEFGHVSGDPLQDRHRMLKVTLA